MKFGRAEFPQTEQNHNTINVLVPTLLRQNNNKQKPNQQVTNEFEKRKNIPIRDPGLYVFFCKTLAGIRHIPDPDQGVQKKKLRSGSGIGSCFS